MGIRKDYNFTELKYTSHLKQKHRSQSLDRNTTNYRQTSKQYQRLRDVLIANFCHQDKNNYERITGGAGGTVAVHVSLTAVTRLRFRLRAVI